MQLNKKLFWRLAVPLGALSAALLAARSCSALGGGMQGRITLNNVTPGSAAISVTVLDQNRMRGTSGVNEKQTFILRPGVASPWFPIGEPAGNRFVRIAVTAAGVKAMDVTLETQGGGPAQTAHEPVQGPIASFYKKSDPDGNVRILPAEQLYKDGLERARAVAVPENERPRRFPIYDMIFGADDSVQSLRDGLQTLALLGMNGATVRFSVNIAAQAPQIAREVGITRFRGTVYNPPSYFAWNPTSQDPAQVDAWAKKLAVVTEGTGAAANGVSLFHMADEPGWYYPLVFSDMMSDARKAELFHSYLRDKGLQPADLGAASWQQVQPIGAGSAHDLPSRRLFYWTVRYITESSSDQFRIYSQALVRQFGPNTMVTSNWNNRVDEFYRPAAGRVIGKNRDIGPDAAMGAPDWMDVARKRALTTLWTEDWFPDQDAETWSYFADALRSAAREGNISFGGYVIGRVTGTHPAGARLKALALLGHGAKALMYYTYGPEAISPTNTYSETPAAYGAIAGANRLIGRSEELLYPGKPTPSRVAILLPHSTQIWDDRRAPLYGREMTGIYYALSHEQYPADFVDEEGIAAGELNRLGTNILYVTAPNMTSAAQQALRGWINNGGTAVFSPGAAAADEYNTPSSVLDQARGVRSELLPHWGMKDSAKVKTRIAVRDRSFGGDIVAIGVTAPLDVAGGEVIADAAGRAMIVSHRFGKGLALSYGFWPGNGYLLSPTRTELNRLPQNWNPELRRLINAAPRITRVPRPVDINVPEVEAPRLDSPAGIAVTLLNWTDEPQQIEVTVHNTGNVASVGTAEKGSLPFTREGDGIKVRLPLRDVDVLMIRH